MTHSSEKIFIAVDACGGDFAPHVVLDGVCAALEAEDSLYVRLCGPADIVDPFASACDRCIPVHAEEVIGMDEHPAEAVKGKRDSSIVVGCKEVREGRAQGFFSAGSTGACLVAATLEIGRIKGVKRPALGVVIPAYKRPTLFLDVGANADCKPEYIVQFARMGSAYVKALLGIDDPAIGLLNIGEEPTKGSMAAQTVYGLLEGNVSGFSGNCEGGALLQGDFDVVVTDGFTGNVTLKTIEGTVKLIMRMLKDSLYSSASGKLGALLAKGSFASLKSQLSPDSFGASPLIGLKGVCMVGHGSSNSEAIKNGILAGVAQVRCDTVSAIARSIEAS